jgi:tetratricopeptide (TPR) repeat protein
MRLFILVCNLLPFLIFAQEQIIISSKADSANSDYYRLLKNYKAGHFDYTVLPYLVQKAKLLNNDKDAIAIARFYIHNYLLKLRDDNLYTTDNITFLSQNVEKAKGKAFSIFYGHAQKIDKLMNQPSYTRDMICYFITRDKIDPVIVKESERKEMPDWNRLEKHLRRKYQYNYVEQSILDAKIRWYSYAKQWPTHCKIVVTRVNKYGPYGLFPDRCWQFNICAWDIFLHSSDVSDLKMALVWSDSAIKYSPRPAAEYFDTYANLLYKMGKPTEAIPLEEKAVRINPADREIFGNLQKMKNGEPTWSRM